ncbi:glutathione peroxidase [Paenibacillus xylanilyticus]|uniref:Glutathione peroxidase n=1 Tax=Paenibacillus xylanilyticus TaxID=248903 RepID=A0A7Y6BXA6_9BACL|nr:glutathione peroxidase [Paenibacillus xylanilyticus]NUU76521.1 glutathione peroxidase [Paenibacillus xylanilyticus]
MNIYSYPISSADGRIGDLSEFAGKVLLIVNTASKCSYSRQFLALQQLYDKYRGQGLEILAFPCDQFNHKEPGGNAEIAEYCKNEFHITFPMFDKIEVAGPSIHPLFRHLTEEAAFRGYDLETEEGQWMDHFVRENHPTLYQGNGIKWNFTKFLIRRNGEVSGRYETTIEPMRMETQIKELLKQL